jgi:hypothetical protein
VLPEGLPTNTNNHKSTCPKSPNGFLIKESPSCPSPKNRTLNRDQSSDREPLDLLYKQTASCLGLRLNQLIPVPYPNTFFSTKKKIPKPKKYSLHPQKFISLYYYYHQTFFHTLSCPHADAISPNEFLPKKILLSLPRLSLGQQSQFDFYSHPKLCQK